MELVFVRLQKEKAVPNLALQMFGSNPNYNRVAGKYKKHNEDFTWKKFKMPTEPSLDLDLDSSEQRIITPPIKQGPSSDKAILHGPFDKQHDKDYRQSSSNNPKQYKFAQGGDTRGSDGGGHERSLYDFDSSSTTTNILRIHSHQQNSKGPKQALRHHLFIAPRNDPRLILQPN